MEPKKYADINGTPPHHHWSLWLFERMCEVDPDITQFSSGAVPERRTSS